jgi:hypothetical protein
MCRARWDQSSNGVAEPTGFMARPHVGCHHRRGGAVRPPSRPGRPDGRLPHRAPPRGPVPTPPHPEGANAEQFDRRSYQRQGTKRHGWRRTGLTRDPLRRPAGPGAPVPAAETAHSRYRHSGRHPLQTGRRPGIQPVRRPHPEAASRRGLSLRPGNSQRCGSAPCPPSNMHRTGRSARSGIRSVSCRSCPSIVSERR